MYTYNLLNLIIQIAGIFFFFIYYVLGRKKSNTLGYTTLYFGNVCMPNSDIYLSPSSKILALIWLSLAPAIGQALLYSTLNERLFSPYQWICPLLRHCRGCPCVHCLFWMWFLWLASRLKTRGDCGTHWTAGLPGLEKDTEQGHVCKHNEMIEKLICNESLFVLF